MSRYARLIGFLAVTVAAFVSFLSPGVFEHADLETQPLLGNGAVLNSRRVENGQPARKRFCFQFEATWKRKRLFAKMPFPSRGELEPSGPPAVIPVSNYSRFGNAMF